MVRDIGSSYGLRSDFAGKCPIVLEKLIYTPSLIAEDGHSLFSFSPLYIMHLGISNRIRNVLVNCVGSSSLLSKGCSSLTRVKTL